MSENRNTKTWTESEKTAAWVILPLSLVLFVPLFVLKGISLFDFWWWFTANLVILLGLIFYFDRYFLLLIVKDLKNNLAFKLVIGFVSAGILYFIFYAGDIIADKLLAAAQEEITDIYRFKGNASLLRITVLMLMIIGPGEELLWRGFAQRVLSKRYGPLFGFFITSGIYTLIHIASGNPMLILAAFVCGVYWGWIYMRGGSLTLNIVSHIVWDISVFVIFPFKG